MENSIFFHSSWAHAGISLVFYLTFEHLLYFRIRLLDWILKGFKVNRLTPEISVPELWGGEGLSVSGISQSWLAVWLLQTLANVVSNSAHHAEKKRSSHQNSTHHLIIWGISFFLIFPPFTYLGVLLFSDSSSKISSIVNFWKENFTLLIILKIQDMSSWRKNAQIENCCGRLGTIALENIW